MKATTVRQREKKRAQARREEQASDRSSNVESAVEESGREIQVMEKGKGRRLEMLEGYS